MIGRVTLKNLDAFEDAMPHAVIPAPFGSVAIDVDQTGAITHMSPRKAEAARAVDATFPTDILEALDAYFQDGTRPLDLSVRHGRDGFHGRCLDALRSVPAGQVVTYADLARMAGSPGAARAVGNACRSNPAALVVPCHRVVAANGLGGYSGGGLDVKRWLLRHEGVEYKE